MPLTTSYDCQAPLWPGLGTPQSFLCPLNAFACLTGDTWFWAEHIGIHKGTHDIQFSVGSSRCLRGHMVDFREPVSQHMPMKGPGAQDLQMLICTPHQPTRPHLAVCWAEAMSQSAQAAQVPLEASQLSA